MNVPKLRFKEFKDEWSTIELYKISSEISYGMGLPSKEYDGINKYIRITDIDENTSKYTNKDIVSPDGELEDKYIVKKNDILFARTGASTGKTYLYDKKDGKLYYAGFLIKANIINHDANFIFQQTHTSKYNKWIKVMSMRSGQPGINSQEYGSYKFSITSKTEEYKISKTLQLLDKKIELQSKKIEALKLFKKGLILSLKKNSFDWHTVCIKDLFKITRGVVIPKNELSEFKNGEHKYPVYSSQTSNQGILGYSDTFDFNGKYLTWTTDGANAGKVFYRNGKFRCTNVCGVLYEDNIKFTNELFAELLNYETPKHVSYVGNPKLMNNVMANIKIKIPSGDVQENTSLIINTINNKVNLEKKKLLKFKELKKGLMQNMFV